MDGGLRARKPSLRIYLSLMHIKFPNEIALFLIIKNFNLCFKKKSPSLQKSTKTNILPKSHQSQKGTHSSRHLSSKL